MPPVVSNIEFRCVHCRYCLMGLPQQGICPECGSNYDGTGPDWEGAITLLNQKVPARWRLWGKPPGAWDQPVGLVAIRLLGAMVAACVLLGVLQIVGTYLGFKISGGVGQRANLFAEFGTYGHKGARFRPNWEGVGYVSTLCLMSQLLLLGVFKFWYWRCLRKSRSPNGFSWRAVLYSGGCIPIATVMLGLSGAAWQAMDIAAGKVISLSWCGTCNALQVSFSRLLFRDVKTQGIVCAVVLYGLVLACRQIALGRKLKMMLSDVRAGESKKKAAA